MQPGADIDVSLLGALLAGVASFITPCVLPIVIPSLGFLAGVGMSQISGEKAQTSAQMRIILTALVFVLGFTLLFTAMGAAASAIGQTLQEHKLLLQRIAGVLIIVMALHFLKVIQIPLLNRQARFEPSAQRASYLSAFVMGLAFAFGWTPCVGPVLAPLLFMAADTGSMTQGALLLFAYGVGIGVPFVLAAAFAGPFLRFVRAGGPWMHRMELVIGVILLLTGLLFLSERGMAWISAWMLEAAPNLWEGLL